MDKRNENKGKEHKKRIPLVETIQQNLTERKKPSGFLLSVLITTIKLFVIFLLILGFSGFGAVLGVAKAYVDGTPALDVNRIEDQSLTSFLYDRNGDLITEYNGLEHRIWASLDEIPRNVQNALIATEDVRFYAHNGLDYKRLAGAFFNNLKSESVQGGSTITQQLVKNTMLSMEQTYKRKIQEAYLSLQLEKEYSKDEILEAYLNTIYHGSGNYGVKVAAEDYFGKDLKDLNLRESAVLIGITKNPYRYDPRLNFYSREKPEVTYKRTNLVLQLMYENGFLSKSDYENARFDEKNPSDPKNKEFQVIEQSSNQKLYDYPYFVEYAIQDLTEALMKQNGWEGKEGRQKANNMILNGGLKIYTTMDPAIQKTTEDTIYHFNGYPRTAKAKDSVKREQHGDRMMDVAQPQASAVVMDHHTGELQAIVGGRMEPKEQFWSNRARLPWAPGSSIKPLAVYAPFIEAGYPGGIILEDVPVSIKGWNGGKGFPSNNNASKYYGPVPLRKAIEQSYNVSAARTVLERVGTDYSMKKLKELGITEPRYVETALPSNLALGSDPINMIELTAAYGTLANKGNYQKPISIRKVLDKDGKVILDNESRQKVSVFKESTAFIMTDLLENAINKGTGTRAKFSGMSIAGKTGTNSDYHGVFFGGYTPYYTTTVVIAPDNHNVSLLHGASGGKFAAPLWKEIMQPIHKGLANKPFYDHTPQGIRSVRVCALSGKLPNGNCKETVTEYFPAGAVPKKKCDMHQEYTVCSSSGKLPTPYCPKDQLKVSSVVVIPKDSVYQKLSDEQLQKYIPGAFRSLTSLDSYDYNNPKQRGAFCPIHGENWKQNEGQFNQLVSEANQLIRQVRESIKQYSGQMSAQDKDALETAINKLKEALSANTPSKEGSGMDTGKVKTEMGNLRAIHEKILSRIPKEPAKDPGIPPNPDSTDNPEDEKGEENNPDKSPDPGAVTPVTPNPSSGKETDQQQKQKDQTIDNK